MNAPRTGIWEIEDGNIKTFGCYPEGTIIFAQLGVLANLHAALTPVGRAQDNDRAGSKRVLASGSQVAAGGDRQ